MINTYNEFIDYVENLGMLAFYGKFLDGFPRLQDITSETQWHTSDPETDPWSWKDRAAAEKKLAFGYLFGGHKGFVAKRCYPLFYAAYRPERGLEEAYGDGLVSPMELHIYQLFDNGSIHSTADIRSALGIAKESSSKADRAVISLQRDFYITVCGNKRKTGKDGKEYGWPANAYARVEDWHADWITGADQTSKPEARERITALFAGLMTKPDHAMIRKRLFGKSKGDIV